MTAEECRPWRERIGALVLGGLDDSETAAVRAHLDGCEECRREAEALTPVATLLRSADPAHLKAAPKAPSGLDRRVITRIRDERRSQRRRRLGLGAAFAGAAAAAAATVVLGVSLLGSDQQAPDAARRVAFDTSRPGLELTAALSPRPWGTEVHMYVHGAREGALCRVWLRGAGSARVPAGSFRYRYDDNDDAAVLTTALPARDVREVGLRVGSHTFVAPVGDGPSAPAA